jgi:hypothetical protein
MLNCLGRGNLARVGKWGLLVRERARRWRSVLRKRARKSGGLVRVRARKWWGFGEGEGEEEGGLVRVRARKWRGWWGWGRGEEGVGEGEGEEVEGVGEGEGEEVEGVGEGEGEEVGGAGEGEGEEVGGAGEGPSSRVPPSPGSPERIREMMARFPSEEVRVVTDVLGATPIGPSATRTGIIGMIEREIAATVEGEEVETTESMEVEVAGAALQTAIRGLRGHVVVEEGMEVDDGAEAGGVVEEGEEVIDLTMTDTEEEGLTSSYVAPREGLVKEEGPSRP